MASLQKEGKEVLSSHISKDDVVIVAPLNWGLGHAARCIPLIEFLLSQGTSVFIASDGLSLKLLSKEFSQLTSYELPSYGISYRKENMIWNMFLQGPSIVKAYLKESVAAKKLASETKATIIISDNRFGFRSSNTKNYYITHQVNIFHPVGLLSTILSLVHRYFIKKFDQCWIPDFEGERSLAGRLSESKSLKLASYLGPLTRIGYKSLVLKWDICILLSGPEPQRTILENSIVDILPSWSEKKVILIRGTERPNPKTKRVAHICSILDLADSTQVADALLSSRLLIARSGYTTIMDIAQLDIKAIFIPTPGQTEQEYLAERLSDGIKYKWVHQTEVFKIDKMMVDF